MNFIQMCLTGAASESEIDDFVDQWHDGEAGKGQDLHEFLGMTWEEYSSWATKPSTLSSILDTHKSRDLATSQPVLDH